MGAGAVATAAGNDGFLQFADPNRKWYNNRRIILLNSWIVLL